MATRQRQKFLEWATAAAFTSIGKAWDGLAPRLEPSSGLAAEGYEPGVAPSSRVFNFLFGFFLASLNRLRHVDVADWTRSGPTTPTSLTSWSSIGYDAGSVESVVVIVADDGEARASTDGQTWTDVTDALTGVQNVVAYVGGTIDRWLALGNSTIYRRVRDLNASDWASVSNPVASNWRALASSTTATEKVVICGTNGKIASSSVAGASAFTNRSPVGSDDFLAACWASGPALYVVVGEAGRIFTSPDGITWTARTSGTASDLIFVAYDARAGVVVAVASDRTVRRSADGITWTAGAAIGGTDPVVAGASDSDGTIVVLQDANAEGFGSTVARRSRVQVTVDGGATWELVGKVARDFRPRALVYGGDLGWLAAGGDNLSEGVVYQSRRI